jgi:hypothetical protein
VNFATKQLFDLTNTIVISPSIDPFFFEISWPEEEEEIAEREVGFEEFEIEGLKYERLSIKKLRLKRLGEEEDEEHVGGKAISRALRRILDRIEHEDEDEDK